MVFSKIFLRGLGDDFFDLSASSQLGSVHTDYSMPKISSCRKTV